jgi:hypothetical protein
MEHTLKTWPEHYQEVADGRKTFELRLNDRPYAVGDTLLLQEYEPLEHAYTGRALRVLVTHILRGGEWLTPGYVCMSIKHCVSSNGAKSALASAEGTQV